MNVDVEAATAVLTEIRSRSWVADGLAGAGGLSGLDARIRPIDELAGAGLGWLRQYVQPVQDVVDRMAGSAAAIQSFSTTWARVSAQIAQTEETLTRAVPRETVDWAGKSAGNYRSEAEAITTAMSGSALIATTMSEAGVLMGEVVSTARQNAGELLTQLVRTLVSEVGPRVATEGVTPAVLKQATGLVDSYRVPIAQIEANVRQTAQNLRPHLVAAGVRGPRRRSGGGSGESVLEKLWRWWKGDKKDPSSGTSPQSAPNETKPQPGAPGKPGQPAEGQQQPDQTPPPASGQPGKKPSKLDNLPKPQIKKPEPLPPGVTDDPRTWKGSVDQSKARLTDDEYAAAKRLAQHGDKVEATPRATVDGKRTPDIDVNGKPVEIKTPNVEGGKSVTEATIRNELNNAKGQSGDIVIDARNTDLTQGDAIRGLGRQLGTPEGDKFQRVRIWGKDFDLEWNR